MKELDKICEEIDEEFYKENSYYLSITEPEEYAKQVALRFGKMCFEAGRDSKKIYNPEKDGKLEMITIIVEYKSFEDYLNNKDES